MCITHVVTDYMSLTNSNSDIFYPQGSVVVIHITKITAFHLLRPQNSFHDESEDLLMTDTNLHTQDAIILLSNIFTTLSFRARTLNPVILVTFRVQVEFLYHSDFSCIKTLLSSQIIISRASAGHFLAIVYHVDSNNGYNSPNQLHI